MRKTMMAGVLALLPAAAMAANEPPELTVTEAVLGRCTVEATQLRAVAAKLQAELAALKAEKKAPEQSGAE